MAFVYKHVNPKNNKPFYIGIGNKIARAFSFRKKSKEWWAIVNKFGYSVEILHSHVTFQDAMILERYYINKHGRADLNKGYLVNLTNGGQGFSTQRGERHWAYGKKHSLEHNLKISNSNKGRKVSDETKAKISAKHKNKKLSAEHRKKLSLAHKGVPLSPEHISKNALGHTGLKYKPRKK